MTNRYLFIIIILLTVVSCQKNTILNNNQEFKFNDSIMTDKTQYEIFYLNKKVIPFLIDKIDKNQCVHFDIIPISSNYPKYAYNQIGIRYAYLIEFILSKDSINVYQDKKYDWIDLDKWNKYTDAHQYEVIMKKEYLTNPQRLTHQDMIKIKEIYKIWWVKNLNKSIKELREVYKESGSILKNSDYIWVYIPFSLDQLPVPKKYSK